MKRETAAILLTVGLVMIAATMLRGGRAMAQAPGTRREPRTISTSGSATVRVRPDSGRVFFGVETIAPTVRAARAENSAKVAQVMRTLGGLGIPDLKMKSSNVRVDLVQSSRGGAELPRILGYRVTHTFTVLVKESDPEKLSALTSRIVDSALENGANMIEQVVFFREDDTTARRQALSQAVEDGLANARALASGAHAEVVGTVNIDGQPEYYAPSVQMAQTNTIFPAEGSAPLVAGDLEITCRVRVTCAF
jgi:uncharacterized protein